MLPNFMDFIQGLLTWICTDVNSSEQTKYPTYILQSQLPKKINPRYEIAIL